MRVMNLGQLFETEAQLEKSKTTVLGEVTSVDDLTQLRKWIST